MSEPVGFQVYVDGTPQPHHSTQGVRVVLSYATGEVCEVQVAKAGADLVVAIAGDFAHRVDERGNLIVSVSPSEKVGYRV